MAHELKPKTNFTKLDPPTQLGQIHSTFSFFLSKNHSLTKTMISQP
jgi:hypothetical protein